MFPPASTSTPCGTWWPALQPVLQQCSSLTHWTSCAHAWRGQLMHPQSLHHHHPNPATALLQHPTQPRRSATLPHPSPHPISAASQDPTAVLSRTPLSSPYITHHIVLSLQCCLDQVGRAVPAYAARSWTSSRRAVCWASTGASPPPCWASYPMQVGCVSLHSKPDHAFR